MALPYTPGQVTVCYKEETDELADSLDGMPVVSARCTARWRPSAPASPVRASRTSRSLAARCRSSLSDTVRTLRSAA